MNPPKTPYPETPKGSELRSINIRSAENGFIGTCSYIKTEKNKRDMCCNWEPDKEYVLTDRDAVLRFVDEVLGTKPAEKAKPKRFGNSV